MSAAIPDQIKMWNRKHGEHEHDELRGSPSPLAVLAEPFFSEKSHVLELGCGVGRDAVYFTGKGHSVLATDGAKAVVRQNKDEYEGAGIEFSVVDMRKKLPYQDGKFDAVFANLSLHYYYDKKTRVIIAEIARVLKPEGVLAFSCKAKDVVRTDRAEEVEKNVFVAPNGHALHTFSAGYVREILRGWFDIVHLDKVKEDYVGGISDVVRCVARKNMRYID